MHPESQQVQPFISAPLQLVESKNFCSCESECVCVGGGVNAIDGNGLVVINISLEITGPFLYWITNHFAFIMIGIFTAQWLGLFHFIHSAICSWSSPGGQRKYLTVDIKESNCTPPACPWPNYPKEICNGVLFCQRAAPCFLSSPHVHMAFWASVCMCAC